MKRTLAATALVAAMALAGCSPPAEEATQAQGGPASVSVHSSHSRR